jgi:predicted enzyme related to lactoylglutathione lyase
MNEDFKKPGVFSWNELMTTDVAAAKAFYGALFGWTAQDMPMESADRAYTMLKLGDKEVGGLMAIPPQAQGCPPHWGCYVTVADADASARKAESLGAKILVPPTDIPGVGRFFVLQDPQGAVLAAIAYV